MAFRPIFISKNTTPYFDEKKVEFEYFTGFSKSQKQKSVMSLHTSAKLMYDNIKPLEVSRAGVLKLSNKLSAFNLTYQDINGENYTVESAFQSSKVFENGGPYIDLLKAPSIVAKKDNRIRESGRIIGFNFLDTDYPSEPKTAFYDWIYINALIQHTELHNELLTFNAFTDIEFNPQKSINCQARSVAIFVSLKKQGLLEDVLKNFQTFKSKIYCDFFDESIGIQDSLFD